eukprot:1160823-Pelagomonas_calceolata.AAC.10
MGHPDQSSICLAAPAYPLDSFAVLHGVAGELGRFFVQHYLSVFCGRTQHQLPVHPEDMCAALGCSADD